MDQIVRSNGTPALTFAGTNIRAKMRNSVRALYSDLDQRHGQRETAQADELGDLAQETPVNTLKHSREND